MDNVQPGQVLGPYRIINQIGQGGMATVYKAYHAAMDRYVAVKVLPRQLAESPEFIGRFQQEARTIAKLEHPHILPVHDYGEAEGFTYLVMRFLDAGTLKDRIAAGRLPAAEIDRLFAQLADALEYAHSHGVVHRDLKPSNVLLDARGSLFLTDFGIAKLLESNTQFTSTGGLIGTPAYMSPEQAQGLKVDQRSDIYSLGIILYELVTGRVPFEAETPLAVVLKHLNDPLPLPSTINPDVSPAVERVILKALAKQPDDRFASTAAFLAAWKEAMAASQTMAAPAPDRAEPETVARAAPTVVAAAPAASAPAAAPARAKFPLVWVLVGAGALVLVLAVGGIALLGSMLGGASEATPTSALVAGATGQTPPTAPAATAGPGVTHEPPLASGQPGWTSWTAVNDVQLVEVYGDRLYAGGPGGLTIWDRASGSVLEQFTVATGLPSPHVTALLLDEDDQTLWVGTGDGLARYDGQRWITYDYADGLDSTVITALAWWGPYLVVGTHYSDREGGGLNLFDGAQWSAMPDFPSAHPDADPNALANFVNAVLDDDAGALWVATTSGLGRYDGAAWARFSTADGLPSNMVYTLMLDDQGALWVGTEAGAARFDGAGFEGTAQGPPYGVYGLAQDFEGRYWFSGGGGVWSYDPATADWEVYSAETGDLPSYTTYAIAVDEHGALYFGSDGAGIVRYDGDFQTWAVPNMPNLAGVGRILPTAQGELWFVEEYGTFTDRLDPGTERWTWLDDLPCEYCAPLTFDREGHLWAGSDLGLWVISGNASTHLTTDQGLPSNQVTSVAFEGDVDRAWIGTDAGLAVFDRHSLALVDVITTIKVDLASNFVRSIFGGSDGSMWVGTDFGLSRLAPGGAWFQFRPGDPFTDEMQYGFVADLAEDAEHAIWVATYGDGAYRFASGNWQRFHPDDSGVGLPSPYVTSVTPTSGGGVWFGTTGGAAYFDGQQWTTYGIGEGLIHPNVNDVYVDDAGAVWFATSGGVTRYVP